MPAKIRGVDRISIAVKSLEAARGFFERHFGAVFGGVEDVADQGYRYVPFTIGGFTLELLEAYNPSHAIARFVARRGEGMYQLSFRVDDLDETARQLERDGVAVVARHSYPEDVTFEGAHWREGFIHPRDAFGVLIHLGERRPAS
jgi:methylmalonyl-CoA/ethylmalonyl-CoA epimerase